MISTLCVVDETVGKQSDLDGRAFGFPFRGRYDSGLAIGLPAECRRIAKVIQTYQRVPRVPVLKGRAGQPAGFATGPLATTVGRKSRDGLIRIGI